MSTSMERPAGRRISALLDPGTFVEIGAKVTARNTDFELSAKKEPSDGVITGYGLIDGRPVYLYSQDAEVMKGSIGEMHAKKIVRVIEMATRMGAPVIAMIDSAGMRLEEATDALYAFGDIYRAMGEASGIVPLISCVFGNCGGGCALLPALSDFRFMEASAKLYLNSPNAIPENSIDKKDTSSAAFQSANAGLADVVAGEEELLTKIRSLMQLLPSNNEEDAFYDGGDDLNRLIADASLCVDDPQALIARLADGNLCFERQPDFGKDMVTALVRLGGNLAGIIANRGAMSADGAAKACGFVKFCDAYSIPIITLANVRRFVASEAEEAKSARALAGFVSTLSQAGCAKIGLITKEAFGTAGLIMNSRAMGADLVYAWNDARVGMMDAESAAKLISGDEGSEAIGAKKEAYDKLQNSIDAASARGYVDAAIAPHESRKYLIGAIELLYTKRDFIPDKKHSTI